MQVDLAMRLCLSQSPPLCHLLGVTSLKPLRPCLNPKAAQQQPPPASPTPMERPVPQSSSGISGDGTSTKKKRVVFADSKGLSLTAVRFFSEREEAAAAAMASLLSEPPLLQLGRLGGLRVGEDSGKTSTNDRRQRLQLGFPQPNTDYLDFRAQLQQNLVQLESCAVHERALSGTVKVRNVSFEKTVSVRITFDSWRSFHDVPCTYLQQRYGGSDTDTFAFEIPLPDILDPRERVEFCVSYTPAGSQTTLWDNNRGRNFRIFVCRAPLPVGGSKQQQKPPHLQKRSLTPPLQRRRLWGSLESKHLPELEPLSPRAATTELLFSHLSWGRLESSSPYW
ncbi:PR3CB phosphatase, partial [Amia calva]|nr:PR3CB phosphatase [Amia calva]